MLVIFIIRNSAPQVPRASPESHGFLGVPGLLWDPRVTQGPQDFFEILGTPWVPKVSLGCQGFHGLAGLTWEARASLGALGLNQESESKICTYATKNIANGSRSSPGGTYTCGHLNYVE